MPVTFFVKAETDPKEVGECILEHNIDPDTDKPFWVMKRENDEWSVYSRENELVPIYTICKRATFIMVEAVDDIIALNVAEPLLKKYGFDSVKWLNHG